MIAWPEPSRSALPGHGPEIKIHDTATGGALTVGAAGPARAGGGEVGIYVCGITPYDAAHLGHAATYLAFDTLHRALLDRGHTVRHVQNVTDVDDPLLERATATGEPWDELARRQGIVFADGMTALAVVPPRPYLGVTEVIDAIGELVVRLTAAGVGYEVPGDGAGPDVYFDVSADPRLGAVSGLDRTTMLALAAERGGDPDRPGKRDPLDPLLWRAARPGEPSWDVPGLPSGRPGWHIECVAIVLDHLGMGFDVQGGGSDLVFPHHELGASHARALTGQADYARVYAHVGMVGLDGEKMSKSRGNLVFVHDALAGGLSPAALRTAILSRHYRSDWSWTEALAGEATARVERWTRALSRSSGPDARGLLDQVRRALASDLDTPTALAAVDAWADAQLSVGGEDPGGPGLAARTLDSLLGIRL